MMRRLVQPLASTALLLAASTHSAAQSQSPSFILDVAAPASQDVALTVESPATLPFKILRTSTIAYPDVTLDATTFTTEQGASVSVLLSVGEPSASPAAHLEVPFTQSLLPVNLHVPTLSPTGRYTGRLILTVAGHPEVTAWRFILSSAKALRPATLVLDQSAVSLTAVRPCRFLPFWGYLGGGDEPVLTIHARDKTGNWPLNGVTARLEGAVKAESTAFDLSAHMTATFNGQETNDLFASPKPDQRVVPEQQQATIRLAFHDLKAGEYTIPLRFSAVNSGDDDLQRLTVTLQVRDSALGAVLVLGGAALLSFLATRVVTMLRQRAAFLGRVRAMRPAWLAAEPPILSVTWLRATLRLAEDLSNRFWLTGQSEIDARITGAAGMLAVLDRMRQVRTRIGMIPNVVVQRRATWHLESIAGQIPAAPLSDEDVARFKSALDKLAEWCEPDKIEAAYWADLLPVIKTSATEVQVDLIPPIGRELANTLLARLKGAIDVAPAVLNLKTIVEDDYARLRILWEVRDYAPLLQQVVDLGTTAPITRAYEVVDNAWWHRLKELGPEGLTLEGPPVASFDPPEAYETVTLRVDTPGAPFLRGTFLMHKRLKYRWTIKILRQRSGRADEEVGTLQVESTEPQVAQYSPLAGQIKASVLITYDGAAGPSIEQARAVPIGKASAFRIWRAFEMADAIAFAVVCLASVVSGVTVYALAPTFGSLKDYLALFTWGAGLDQGKNFLQSLAAYSDASKQAA